MSICPGMTRSSLELTADLQYLTLAIILTIVKTLPRPPMQLQLTAQVGAKGHQMLGL